MEIQTQPTTTDVRAGTSMITAEPFEIENFQKAVLDYFVKPTTVEKDAKPEAKSGGGFFGKLFGGIKKIVKGAIGTVGNLAKGLVNPKNWFKPAFWRDILIPNALKLIPKVGPLLSNAYDLVLKLFGKARPQVKDLKYVSLLVLTLLTLDMGGVIGCSVKNQSAPSGNVLLSSRKRASRVTIKMVVPNANQGLSQGAKKEQSALDVAAEIVKPGDTDIAFSIDCSSGSANYSGTASNPDGSLTVEGVLTFNACRPKDQDDTSDVDESDFTLDGAVTSVVSVSRDSTRYTDEIIGGIDVEGTDCPKGGSLLVNLTNSGTITICGGTISGTVPTS